MRVSKDKAVSLDYTLSGGDGEVIDTSAGKEPLTYIHGNGCLVKGFEAALDGRSPEDAFSFTVSPGDGYGDRRDDLIFQATREQLGEIPDLSVGMPLRVQTPNDTMVVRVAGIEEDKVLLDANHPLAGISLTFDVKILDVRDATEEELGELSQSSTGCAGSCSEGCGEGCCG